MLGPNNDGPAREALQAWPGGLQVGGGINDKNAKQWMDAGAEKVTKNQLTLPGLAVADIVLGHHHILPIP